MNIVTEITPNPETLKFKVSKDLLKSNGIEFKRVEDAQENKFIEELFGIDGVKSIFVGSNFVSITKKTQAVWGQLKAKILIFLVDYLNSHEIIFNEKKIQIENDDNNLIKDKTSKKIKDIIDAKVRPAVARDGGDIIFRNFKNGIVYLTLKGACAGCPSSTATLKQGIENLLKHYFPEVQSVQEIN